MAEDGQREGQAVRGESVRGRALQDEEVRENVKSAIAAAREVYAELIGARPRARSRRSRDRQGDPGEPREGDRRPEKGREQGAGQAGAHARNAILLLTGIVLGMLFSPFTGPQTSEWLAGQVLGRRGDPTGPALGNGNGPAAWGRLRAGKRRARAARRPRAPATEPASDPSPPLRLSRASRANEPGSRPVAFEMSRDWSRIAPGFGAWLESEIGGAQPETDVSGRSISRCQAVRVRRDGAVVALVQQRGGMDLEVEVERRVPASPVLPMNPRTSPALT